MRKALPIAVTLALTALTHCTTQITAPTKPVVPIGDTPAVSRLAQAITAYEKRDFFTAVHLLSATGQPPKLRDYVVYYLANAELMTNNGADAVRDLNSICRQPVSRFSALRGPHHASSTPKRCSASTPQPSSTPLKPARSSKPTPLSSRNPMAITPWDRPSKHTGFPRQAVVYYQRVYYSHPASDLADKAKIAFDKLRSTLGADYPEATPRQQLDRANAWLTAKQYLKARQEFIALSTELAGGDRDQAQAGIGAAFFLNNEYANTISYLAPLHPEGTTLASAEGAAERLYYLTESYRHSNGNSAMLETRPRTRRKISAIALAFESPHHRRATATLLTQDRAQYVPLYQAAANSFPGDSNAALCHWRVVWAAWLDHSPRRVELLKEQIEKFPSDTHVSDALFFLGRAAEQDSEPSAARGYYERLDRFFPHYYYSGLRARPSRRSQNSHR